MVNKVFLVRNVRSLRTMYIDSRYTFALTNDECGMDRLTVNFECVRTSEYRHSIAEHVTHSANFSSRRLNICVAETRFSNYCILLDVFDPVAL